jgi:arginase
MAAERQGRGRPQKERARGLSTPESSSTGFIDGTGVAMLTGRFWTAATRTIPGFAPVPDEFVLLVGQRDFDDDEVKRLEASAINMVPWPAIAESGVERALVGAFDELTSRVGRVHLHLDMDVHNQDLAHANHFRPPGGLAPQQTVAAGRMIAERFELTSASVAAYDPKWDDAGLAAALALVDVIGAVIRDRRR